MNYTGTRPTTPGLNTTYGAFATVGSNSGASISLVSVDANNATATSDATIKSTAYGGGTNISGTLTVNTYATSYADANIHAPAASVKLVNVSVNDVVATAKGTYSASMDTTGSETSAIKAANVKIGTGYNTNAVAKTGPSGAIISGLSVSVNKARAYTQTNALATVVGSGGTNITGNIDVRVNGDAKAYATINQPAFSIAIANLATNAPMRIRASSRRHTSTSAAPYMPEAILPRRPTNMLPLVKARAGNGMRSDRRQRRMLSLVAQT